MQWFVDRCLSHCTFSFGLRAICPSIYGFWLSLLYLLTHIILFHIKHQSVVFFIQAKNIIFNRNLYIFTTVIYYQLRSRSTSSNLQFSWYLYRPLKSTLSLWFLWLLNNLSWTNTLGPQFLWFSKFITICTLENVYPFRTTKYYDWSILV